MSGQVFSQLDSELPLTLLPVRIETRYLPRRKPTHLFVRIFPDVVHADSHRMSLTTREAQLGKQFWYSVWQVTEEAQVAEARRWLAAQVGPYRALWVSTVTRPTNLGKHDAKPAFPQISIQDARDATVARLLPDRWMVRLYDANLELVHTAFSSPVPANLPMAPTLSPKGVEANHPTTGKRLSAPEGFLHGQGLLWTVDFGEAERVGMALRIPVENVPDPVGALLVLGARAERDILAEGDAFDALLAAHWYTQGLDLMPQGTPTNNTDAGRSGMSLSDPDVDLLFEREAFDRPLAPLGRAALIAAKAASLYRIPAADAASLAFGRVRTNMLDRVDHAERNEGLAGWAMNLVVGYATIGRYLTEPLSKLDGSTARGADAGTLRDWYADWVRGGGPLPILRCGEQPYGLLPIGSRPVENIPLLDFEAKLEHYLAKLYSIWQASLPVPTLDPDATDGRPSSSAAQDALTVAEVLGAVPHPAGLRLRGASDNIAEDFSQFTVLIESIERYIERDVLKAKEIDAQSEIDLYWTHRKPLIVGGEPGGPPVVYPTISTQLANLDFFRQEVEVADARAEYETLASLILPLIDDQLRPLLQTYADASAATPSVLWDWHEGGGLGSDGMIRLTGTTFDEHARDAHDLVTSDGNIEEIRDLLQRADALLRDAAQRNTPPLQRIHLVKSRSPLLAHLIDITCRTVPVGEIAGVLAGLQVLLALIDAETARDPHAELERLMRETLGLAMHRMDAWVTGLASKKLAEKRKSKAAGMQIGAYGWLLDLKRSGEPTSQGFIHAPSLTHAAAAAVLRAGWNAYGTRRGETPLSVDLSSDRVRGGLWILDGVRNGQDLAELLGGRFERYLHDAHLDDWIRTIRVHALEAAQSKRPPNAVVDGLLVARAASNMERSERETTLRAALDAALAATGNPNEDQTRARVWRALRTIAADLDSVADLALTQSVHSILQGNADAAAAMIALTGGSDAAVPPVTVADTQRDAQLISHRVIALWPAPAVTAEEAMPLHAAEPRLVTWLEGLLPRPSQIVAEIVTRENSGAETRSQMSLEDVGVSIVEAALLAGAGVHQADTRLGRVIQAAAARIAGPGKSVEVRYDTNDTRAAEGEDTLSIDEFGLIATTMRDAVGRCRALRAEDLLMPGNEAPADSVDVAELQKRIAPVEEAIQAVIAGLAGTDATLRDVALTRAAVIGVSGAIRALEVADPAPLIERVAEALRKRLPSATPESAPTTDSVSDSLDRLQVLIGKALPILPVFTLQPNSVRVASASSRQRQKQVATDGLRWLRQVGRVHPAIGAINEFFLMTGTVADAPSSPLGLVQMPEAGGPWAAVERPSTEGDHCCIVSLTGAEQLKADNTPIAGVLIESWTESIPKREQQTGIAVHFDSPSARPPQAILLSVVAGDAKFSADELSNQILHTIELAKFRAVGADRIAEIGQFLPAVFLPEDVTISGRES
jgi:hypothetical protein